MSLLRIWLARVTRERTAAAGVVLLLFATSLTVAIAPRALDEQAGIALRRDLSRATGVDRAMVIHEAAGPRTDPPPEWQAVMDSVARLEQQLPPELAALVNDRRATLDSAYWQVHSGPALSALLRLRLHDGAFERVNLASGRLPTDRIEVVPDERQSAAANQRATVYEAILPATAAERLRVGEGDLLPIETWRGDPTNTAINIGALLRIVGTYELAQPESDFWINDLTVGGWRIFTVGTNDYVETSALLAPAVHDELVPATHGAGMTLLYQYRFLTDTGRLVAADVPPAITALRRLAGNVPRSGMSDIASDTRLNTGLLRVLEAHSRMWQSTAAVLSLVGLGVLVIAMASLAAVLAVASTGRQRVAALLRARGAASRQVLGPAAAEMAALAAPPALAALAVAVLLLPGPGLGPAAVLVGLVALLAVVIGLAIVNRAATLATVNRPARGRRLSARRLVAELFLAGGALAGAWLLRERGINALSGTTAGADPLIAAALALVGVAAGVIAIRLYPLPARALGALVALRRDLLPVLAVRRAVRGGSSATLLFLLVATATVGTFASAALIHLDRSAELGAWQALGAEHRVSPRSGALPAALEPAELPAIEAHSMGTLRLIQASGANAWLMTVDPAAHARVAGGTPADPALPGELSAEPAGDTLPVVAGNMAARRGDTIEARIDRTTLQLRVVRVAPTFPGVPLDEPYVVAATDQLTAALGGRNLPPNYLLLRAPADAADELLEAAQAVEPSLLVQSRSRSAEEARTTPAMGALRALMAAGALLAIAYAAVAAAAALALSGAAQRDEVAHLRALGLSRRGHAWLTLVEYGPAGLVGYLVGVGLGLALFQFLAPALGLAAITGSALEIPVIVEASHLAALLAAMLAILLVGWLASVLAQRDTNPATAIRRGVD